MNESGVESLAPAVTNTGIGRSVVSLVSYVATFAQVASSWPEVAMPLPAFASSSASVNVEKSPFCWASPALVVLRLKPSETANVWKITAVAIRPIRTPTRISIRLKPPWRRERAKWRGVLIG